LAKTKTFGPGPRVITRLAQGVPTCLLPRLRRSFGVQPQILRLAGYSLYLDQGDAGLLSEVSWFEPRAVAITSFN